MTTAAQVLKVAQSQVGIKESPAGSNNVKYNTWFYGHKVSGERYSWCSVFVDWCFWKAGGDKLFPHNSNAAFAQDEIVSKCHGKWVMKKTGSKSTKLLGFRKAKAGDVVDFDFAHNDCYRRHIGIVLSKTGEYYKTIEGNTSAGSSGSQSNGGMVALRTRHYTEVCSIARPAYSDAAKADDLEPDPVTKPLTVDGIMGFQTACRLQKWLGVSVDGEVGPNTVRALQKKVGAKPVDGKWGNGTSKAFQRYLNKHGAKLAVDGVFGKASVRALQTYLNKVYSDKPTPKPTPKPSKTAAEKIAAMAKACAWPSGTKKSKYAYPGGEPTPEFKAAINKAYPDRSSWGKQTRSGASCDVFVGVVIRATGVDPKFPRGLDGVVKHCKGNPIWKMTGIKSTSKLEPGDVIYQEWSGGGHISIYVGDGKIANAHYVGKTYGVIEKASNLKSANKCQIYNVYRAK